MRSRASASSLLSSGLQGSFTLRESFSQMGGSGQAPGSQRVL